MVKGVNADFGFFQNALNLRAHRQELLASNIANADTPNYKAVDMDFSKVLRGAQASPSPLAMDATSAEHLQGRPVSPLGARVMYRVPTQPSIDGNTVDSNLETAQFSDNAIHYQALLGFLSEEIRMRKMAIQGQ